MVRRSMVVALVALAACAPPKKAGETVTKSFTTACAADTRTIRSAEEAFHATDTDGNYATMEQLVPRYLSEPSELHKITDVVDGSYKLRVADKRCGNTSDVADANLVDDAHPGNV